METRDRNRKLDDADVELLATLERGTATVDALAAATRHAPDAVADRLDDLADNGLVRPVPGAYALTEDGRRVIVATPRGTLDQRIDTPPNVEAAIEAFDLRADREEAVRNAFAYLRYWGSATADQIVAATYSEDPAGYASSDAWWRTLVRDRLATLPDVVPPAVAGGEWQYVGPRGDADDGRRVLDGTG